MRKKQIFVNSFTGSIRRIDVIVAVKEVHGVQHSRSSRVLKTFLAYRFPGYQIFQRTLHPVK